MRHADDDQRNRGQRSAEVRAAAVLDDVVRRRRLGEALDDDEVLDAHPDIRGELERRLRALRLIEQAESRARDQDEHTPETADAIQPPMAPVVDGGRLRFPGYTLTGVTHRGGQGVVYQAIQNGTGRMVGIKVMRDGPLLEPNDAARFRREVRLLARLKHPNIVTIHDSGVAAGNHFFVMDYIAGCALDEHVERGRLTVRETLALFAKVCEAVSTAHLRGIIHRDLKPSNIRIDEHGEPHVLDFGLAKVASEQDEATRTRTMTITGQFVGSLPWASPEQADGGSEQIDLRTDVYSLGVVLYQLLTGRFPYGVTGKMREVLDQILTTDPARPSRFRKEIDNEVETMVLKCLAKTPERRYQSAGELARDIRRYLADEPIEAKRDSTFYVLRKQMRRHRVPLAIIAGFMLLIVASSIVGWTLYGEARQNLRESYLAQAHAHRIGGQMGQRFDALAAIKKAAAIRPSIELRDEAIAAMALADMRIAKQIEPDYPTQRVLRFRFSPNGQLFWICDRSSGEIAVRSFADNRTLMTAATGRTESGPFARFSPDSRRIAIATASGCEVWHVERATVIDRIEIDVSNVGDRLAYSADGRALAIANKDGSILMHRLDGGEDRVLPALGRPILWIECHPMGERIANSFLGHSEVVIRNAQNGDLVHRLEHPASVWKMAWSPDGRQLAVGCSDANVYLWDATRGVRQFALRGHDGTVGTVGYNSSGDMLFSSDWGGVTKLWDPRRGVALLAIPGKLGLSFAAGSNRLLFASFSDGFALGAAEVTYGYPLRTVVGHPFSEPKVTSKWVDVCNDGSVAVTCSHTGFRIWNLKTEQQVCRVHLGRSVQATFARDGSTLFTVTDQEIWRWPIKADANVRRIGPPVVVFQGAREEGIDQCCLSPDGKTVYVTSSERDHALVFDALGRGEPRRIGSHPGFRYISISPDGRWLASGAWRGLGAKVWNPVSGELVHEFPIESNVNVGFSPDGRWLVTSAADHIVWKAGTWQPVARFSRPDFRSVPGPITFSSDGNLLAVRGVGATIELIDLTRMESIAHLECPGISGFAYLAFTPDGTRLVFPHPKRSDIIQVWDLRMIREQLADMNLDWDLPPYPPPRSIEKTEPLQVEIDLGELGEDQGDSGSVKPAEQSSSDG